MTPSPLDREAMRRRLLERIAEYDGIHGSLEAGTAHGLRIAYSMLDLPDLAIAAPEAVPVSELNALPTRTVAMNGGVIFHGVDVDVLRLVIARHTRGADASKKEQS